MDTKNVCGLCLVSKNEIIHFFGDEAIKLNITNILVQHFWFQIHRDDNLAIGICRICWKCVNDFHEFYKNIEEIHKNHYNILQLKNDFNMSKIKSEIIDSNNASSQPNINSNNELIKPKIELNKEYKKGAGNRTKQLRRTKSISNKTLKLHTLTSKSIKTADRKIIKKNKNKIIMNSKLSNIKNTVPILTEDGEQQFIEDNRVIVNEIINDDVNEIKDDLGIDKIFFDNKNLIENHEKSHNNPIRNAENIKIKEFYNLKCEICSSQHSTLNEVKKHYLIAHNSKNGYVLCCNKKLFKRCKLLEHMLWHTNPDEFRCKICNQIYANKSALKIHMHFHSTPEERTYICDICDASFTLRYHLMKHFRKTHLAQKNIEFKCNRCDKTFNKNSILQNHIRGVHELKNLNICPICAKVYKSKQQCEKHYLAEHINVNKPKLKCNLCDALLKNEKSLKCHMLGKHFAEPEACKLCDKIAPNKHALQKHMKDVHSESKHKCNLCDKAFKRPIRLQEHMATHSGHSYLYACPYCTTQFNSDANMYSHRKKKHPNEWLADRQRKLGITVHNS